MRDDASYSELIRLRKEQTKTREEEVFGGLLPAERAQYDQKAQRINELEIELRNSGVFEKSIERGAERKQRSQWNEEAERDAHQSEAHQPYRSREEGPSMQNDSKLSNSDGRNRRKASEEKEDE